jgi:hypothetical protein
MAYLIWAFPLWSIFFKIFHLFVWASLEWANNIHIVDSKQEAYNSPYFAKKMSVQRSPERERGRGREGHGVKREESSFFLLLQSPLRSPFQQLPFWYPLQLYFIHLLI